MDYALHDAIGNLGVLLIVGTYFLVQIGRMSAVKLPYVVMNGVGALLILYSLLFDFNMSAFVIEITWSLISAVGIVRIMVQRRRATG